MKVIFVFATLFAVVLSQANPADRDAVVLRSESDNDGLSGYQYAYETSNGIAAQESAQLKNAGSENEAIEARGQYEYTGPDGQRYVVSYVANEDGFQPQGAHLPQPPAK